MDLVEDKAQRRAFQSRSGSDRAPPKTWQQFTAAAPFFTSGGLDGTEAKGDAATEWLANPSTSRF